jgi:multidrug resistance protein
MQPADSTPARRNTALWIILSILLLDVIGLTILFPVVPYIVQRYSSSASTVTSLSVIYAVMQFIAAPALGQISDRIGRRPVLLWSVFGSAVGYFLFGIGGALWVLLLSRFIDGVTGGNVSTASAYIADVSKPHERAKNFALIGVAWGFGFIIGPALGGLASQISLEAPAYLAGILSFINVIAIYLFLPESLPPERRTHAPLQLKNFNPFGSIRQIASKPGMPILFAVTLAFAFAFAALSSVQNVYVARKFSVDSGTLAFWLLLGGIGTAVSQFFLADKLIKRFGERVMGMASLGFQAFGASLLALAPWFTALLVSAPVLGMMRPFIWGSLGALTAAKVQPREQGVLSGVNVALQSSMSVIGPLVAGAMYDTVSPPSPLWLAFAMFIFGTLLLSRVSSNKSSVVSH